MEDQEILAAVSSAIESTLKTEGKEIHAESRLIEDLGGDSLDMLELIMSLEERFGIEVPDEDAEYIKTVRDVVEYVKKRLAEGA
ncbi:MAG: acyl carrier protein [Bacillota bacterium]|nr:acyl carrier protein [Bacillota bacterium]